MEKTKSKRFLSKRLIAFVLSFAMIVSVLTGVLPGTSMSTSAKSHSISINAEFVAGDTMECGDYGVYFKCKQGTCKITGNVKIEAMTLPSGENFRVELDKNYEIVGGLTGNIFNLEDYEPGVPLDQLNAIKVTDGVGSETNPFVFTVIKAHVHNFSYNVNAGGDSITASCTSDCPEGYYTNGIKLTLSAPPLEELEYNGYAKVASINGYPDTAPDKLAPAPTEIIYYATAEAGSTTPSGEALSEAPKAVGNYVAEMTWGGKTARVPFTVTKKIVKVTWGNTDLEFTGAEQAPTAVLADGSIVSGEKCELEVSGQESAVNPPDLPYYTAKATLIGADKDNYVISSDTKETKFRITPIKAKLKWVKTILEYNGEEQLPEVIVENKKEGEDVTVVLTGAETEVGIYTAKFLKLEGKDAANYGDPVENTEHVYSIVKKDSADFTVKLADWTYGSAAGTPEIDGLPAGAELKDVIVEYKPFGESDDSYDTMVPSIAGKYNIRATLPVTESYEACVAENVFNINPKELTLKWSDRTTHVYDGTAFAPSVEISGVVGTDNVDPVVIGEATNVGSYVAEVKELKGTAAPNYKLPAATTSGDPTKKDFTITRKEIQLVWGETTFVYDGDEHVPTCTVEGLVEGDVCDVKVGGAATDAGSYTARAEGLTNPNYVANIGPSSVCTFTIEKAEIEPLVLIGDWTYGDDAKDPAIYFNTGKGDVSYEYFTDADCTTKTTKADDGAAAEGKVPTFAGTYYVKATVAETANYKAGTDTDDFTIAKKVLDIEWTNVNLTYNGEEQEPEFEATNIIEGDTVNLEVIGDATDAGEYEATVQFADDASARNYDLPEVTTHSYTIAKLTAELQWDANRIFIYNAEDQAPEVEVANLIGDDECTVTVSGKATEAGKHTATAVKLSNTNYALPVDGTEFCDYEIIKATKKENPAALSITDWTYGDQPNDPVVENNISGGTVNFSYAEVESLEALDAALENPEDLEYSITKPSDAGFYVVKAAIGETTNYEAIDLYTGLIISQKTVQLEWDEESLIFEYDGDEHVPVATVSNLEYADKVEVTVDGATSKVGEHTAKAVELTGDSADNYKLSEVEAENEQNFKITNGKFDFVVTITGWTYGEEANEPKVVFLDEEFEPEITYYLDEECTIKTGEDDGAEAEGGVPAYAGTYYVKASLEVENYDPYYSVAGFAIEQRQLDAEWSDTSFTYDGKAHIPTATAVNVVEGDEVTFTVSEEQIAAGEYEAMITFMAGEENKRNYKLPEILTQTFKIGKRTAELDWDKHEFVYTGFDQCPIATLTSDSLIEGDDVEVVVTGAATVFGIHVATAVKLIGEDAANYEFSDDVECYFAILKADLKKAAVSMNDWTYGDQPDEPVVKNNIGAGTITFSYAKVIDDSVVETPEDIMKIVDELEFTTAKPKDAGLYVIKAEIAETENYNSIDLYNSFKILPKTVFLSWSDLTFEYDGEPHKPTCEVTNLEYGDEVGVQLSEAETEVGEHESEALELIGDRAANYELPTTTTQSFEITRGEPGFVVTMSGWIYGEKPEKPIVEGNPGKGDIVFTYYVDQELTEKTSESDGAEEEGEVPAYAGTYYVKAELAETTSYKEDVSSAEFTIEPRAIFVDWTETEFVYNGESQGPEADLYGVIDGDDVEAVITGLGTDAGEYEAKVLFLTGEKASNYTLPDVVSTKFTIEKLVAKFAWGETVFEYTGSDQCPTVKMTNLVKGDTCKVIVTGAATAIGQHKATVVRLTNKNYALPDDAEQLFTITKATQKITANNLTIKFGDKAAIGAKTSGDGKLSYTVKSGKDIVTVDAKGNVTGINEGTATVEITAAETAFCKKATKTIKVTVTADIISIYRVYNPNSGEHVYTKDANEKDNLVKAGWKDEGVAWKSPSKSNTPVYRLYNKNAGDHHYTVSADERAKLVKAGWKDEGIAWYSDDLKTNAVYRVYNPNAKTGSHHFTLSKTEVQNLVKAGWKDEGVAFYSR